MEKNNILRWKELVLFITGILDFDSCRYKIPINWGYDGGSSSMVERGTVDPETRVRFSSIAPKLFGGFRWKS